MKRLLLIILSLILALSVVACGEAKNDNTDGSRSEDDTQPSTENNSDDSSEESDETSDKSDITDITDESSEDTSSEPSSDTTDVSDDDIISAEIANVTITFIGEDDLAKEGFRIEEGDDVTVSVRIEGAADIVNGITADDITASVDVSDIREEGAVEVMITYFVPENVELVGMSDSFITLKIEKSSSEVVPPVVDDVRVVNGVLIAGTRAMETFGGSASGGQKTANMLNEFKQTMGDVNVYVLPAPLASAFYAPEGYSSSITRHQECFYGVRDNLVNVGFVDTLSALAAHANEELYFRTDHHWQALAAYYACEELARVAGVSFDDISTFVKKSEEGILGSFYTSYTHDAVLKANPDTMTWYEPTREYTVEYYSRDGHDGSPITGRTLFSTNSGYTKFVYGDSYTTHIKTNVGNGRKLLIFKDSYGNALAPFLVGSFDEIIVADYRHFKEDVSDFIAEQGITDVCFSLAAFKVNNCNAVDINY